jgi:hypothetical protein
MSDVTRILSAIEQGYLHAAAQFLPDHIQVVAARCHDSARRSETPRCVRVTVFGASDTSTRATLPALGQPTLERLSRTRKDQEGGILSIEIGVAGSPLVYSGYGMRTNALKQPLEAPGAGHFGLAPR